MLRRIGLTNFKCWKELDIELAPITLLFGANSSGKSAILQSLLMLKQTVASRDPNQHLNFGGGARDYVDLGSYRDLVLEHDENQPIGMSLAWDTTVNSVFRHRRAYLKPRRGPAINLEYEVAWRWENDVFVDHLGYQSHGAANFECFLRLDRIDENNYRVNHSDSTQSIFATIKEDLIIDDFIIDEEHNPETIPDFPRNCYILPLNIRLRDASENRFLYEPQFAGAFENITGQIRYLGPLRQYPRRFYQWTGERKKEVAEPDGADTFAALVSSERDDGWIKEGVAAWLRKLDLVQDLTISAAGSQGRFYEVLVKIDDVESALLDVGFGLSQVLPVLTMLLSAPEGSIALLEQPELHLHPNAQAALADLMLHVAESRNLQLIVESHSEHIVRRLQRRIAETESEYARPDNIKMYFCEPGKDGSRISEVEVDRFGQISNWPEKFLGDISGDLHAMVKAALTRRRTELENA